jgi:colanic acid/amylovoran biosynthesis protein
VERIHSVSESSGVKHKPFRIGLLGASFDTGNMGVSALAESSIKIIINRWPDAEITLLGCGYVPGEYHLSIMGREISIPTLPIRFCKNIFLPYHFLWFAVYSLAAKIPAGVRLRKALIERNRYYKVLFETDFVADITGGDSFSDIYGFRRLLLGFLCKWLVLFGRKKLVLLPQTYGPFKSRLSRFMAKYILKHASAVYSRDRESLEYAKDLLNDPSEGVKVRFVPDVAFVLDSRRPDNQDIDALERVRASNKILVGLNISGLLTLCNFQNDVFGLKTDYFLLINEIVELLMTFSNTAILLVPHTVAINETKNLSDKRNLKGKGYREQSDMIACSKIYERFAARYYGRIFLVRGRYDHNETKYIIGLCDFFIGSRMHSCIAALSQHIPAVGLAYSKKFNGVFESIGLPECIVDARICSEDELRKKVSLVFERRDIIRKHLQNTISSIQCEVLDIFKDSKL